MFIHSPNKAILFIEWFGFLVEFCCHAAGGVDCRFALVQLGTGEVHVPGWSRPYWTYIRSSASLYSSNSVGSSRPQYPSRWHRLTSDSSFAWSPAEHIPCNAGPAYVIFAKTVARKTSCSDTSGMPWTRMARSAYSRLLLDASRLTTGALKMQDWKMQEWKNRERWRMESISIENYKIPVV